MYSIGQRVDNGMSRDILKYMFTYRTDEMALSLTVEETNFLRLVALTIGVAPRAVRCYFDGVFHPNNLQTTLLNQQKTIDNLRYRKKSSNISSVQHIISFRNISGIAPPVTGYDTLPSPSDISKGADLARIKHYRNKIAHSTDSKLLSQEFEDAWNDLGTAIGRLGGIVFQQECFSLKSSNLDSECYKDILLNIRHSQDEVSHTMANMVEALTKKTLDMENILQDTVPQNIRGRV
ncbi:unnamed protein product [Mytilus edulis]|uniref:DZIP3-like HEPN domain-containing protein n=1 Tax=Mytilus edulis TaxID=6550 RepID=A0A8S3TQM9_MYTED|nr:unnamed protein product [Mytilus edulis]